EVVALEPLLWRQGIGWKGFGLGARCPEARDFVGKSARAPVGRLAVELVAAGVDRDEGVCRERVFDEPTYEAVPLRGLGLSRRRWRWRCLAAARGEQRCEDDTAQREPGSIAHVRTTFVRGRSVDSLHADRAQRAVIFELDT